MSDTENTKTTPKEKKPTLSVTYVKLLSFLFNALDGEDSDLKHRIMEKMSAFASVEEQIVFSIIFALMRTGKFLLKNTRLMSKKTKRLLRPMLRRLKKKLLRLLRPKQRKLKKRLLRLLKLRRILQRKKLLLHLLILS